LSLSKSQTAEAEIKLVQVFLGERILDASTRSDKIVTDFSAILAADLYIIAVSDDAIASVSDQLPSKIVWLSTRRAVLL
jgi:hypothetical protein